MSKTLIKKLRCGCEFWEGLDTWGEVYPQMNYCEKHEQVAAYPIYRRMFGMETRRTSETPLVYLTDQGIVDTDETLEGVALLYVELVEANVEVERLREQLKDVETRLMVGCFDSDNPREGCPIFIKNIELEKKLYATEQQIYRMKTMLDNRRNDLEDLRTQLAAAKEDNYPAYKREKQIRIQLEKQLAAAKEDYANLLLDVGRLINQLATANLEVERLRAGIEKLKEDLYNIGKRYIRGGDGSHWEGCEETHWDCKIAKLERQLAAAEGDAEEAVALLRMADISGERARNVHAPEDEETKELCEKWGYGAVIDAAARLWYLKDDCGAFAYGPCVATIRHFIAAHEARLKEKK